MKKARLKNILKTISETLNRFLAITAIVALGAGFLGGLKATTPDMKAAADAYMDKYCLYDLDAVNYLGFTDEEIKLIKDSCKIEKMQKANVSDEVFIDSENKRLTIRIFGILPDNGEPEINRFQLTDGRFPENDSECLLQVISLYGNSMPHAGDELRLLSETNGNYSEHTLKISGIVKSPVYFSAELEPTQKGSGALDMALYVHPGFFTRTNPNHVFMTLEGASQLDTWSEEYKTLVSEQKALIESALKDEIYSRIDSLNDLQSAVFSIFDTAEEADRKLLKSEISSKSMQNEVIKILQNNGANKSLTSAIQSDSEKLKNLTSARTDYSIAKDTVSALFSKTRSFRENIFSVNTRNQSTGYASYKDNIEKIDSLSRVFPVFFFFIALLVSLTTMTRLIEEKRNEIGTLKSLGFSSFQLLGEFLLYAFLSSVIGCAIGLAIGFKLFPAAVTFSYGMMYSIPIGPLPFRWNIAIPVSCIATGVIMVATAAACISETVARPAVLMAPKAPAPGKRILLEHIHFIWDRLSFSRKVTLRNMFRYKKRLWMTLTGIAGCSALLVAGFGLRDSLQDIITVQFDELSVYNVYALVNGENAFETDPRLHEFLNDKDTVSDWLKVSSENVKVSHSNREMTLSLYVPEDENKIENFMILRTRKSHKKIPLSDDGIVITEKQCEVLGIKPGDTVTLQNATGKKTEVKVTALSECYMYGNVYANTSVYKKMFGVEPVFNAALCNLTQEKNNQQTVSSLMESDSVIYAMWIDSLLDSAHKNIAAIDVIVFVIIITSGLLSVIVLYNLTNINICERKREIATLFVLGYTEKEAKKYIFRETNILSIAGSLIGMLLGGPLHSIVVHSVEVNVIMWGRSVHPASYVYAFLVSLIFTLGVNFLMGKTIVNIDMVESLKCKD